MGAVDFAKQQHGYILSPTGKSTEVTLCFISRSFLGSPNKEKAGVFD